GLQLTRYENWDFYDTDPVWVHTPPENIAPVLLRAETQFRRAMSARRGDHEVLEAVAHLHYYTAHAMPFERGTAAITDMAVRAILDARGIENGMWREGLLPDVEALVTPEVSHFVDAYPYYFERP